MTVEECSWDEVDRLLGDLKRDGYEPIQLSTTTSAPVDRKLIRLTVERSEKEDIDDGV